MCKSGVDEKHGATPLPVKFPVLHTLYDAQEPRQRRTRQRTVRDRRGHGPQLPSPSPTQTVKWWWCSSNHPIGSSIVYRGYYQRNALPSGVGAALETCRRAHHWFRSTRKSRRGRSVRGLGLHPSFGPSPSATDGDRHRHRHCLLRRRPPACRTMSTTCRAQSHHSLPASVRSCHSRRRRPVR